MRPSWNRDSPIRSSRHPERATWPYRYYTKTSPIIGIQRRIDDILHRHTRIIRSSQLLRARRHGNPVPLMRRWGDNIVFLPVIQIPCFPTSTHHRFLRSAADTLPIAAGPSAHDEDFLSAVQLVHGLADQESVHGVDESDFVDAGEVQEETTFQVGADVAGAFEVVAMHEHVVCGDVAFHCFEDDGAEDAAEDRRFFKGVVLTVFIGGKYILWRFVPALGTL